MVGTAPLLVVDFEDEDLSVVDDAKAAVLEREDAVLEELDFAILEAMVSVNTKVEYKIC